MTAVTKCPMEALEPFVQNLDRCTALHCTSKCNNRAGFN